MQKILPKTINPHFPLLETMPIIIDVMCRRTRGDNLHMHDCSELWYALSGEAEHNVGGKTFLQTPGVCITIPAFVPHIFSTEHSDDTPIFLRINVYDKFMRDCGYNYFSYCDRRIFFEGSLLPIAQHFSGEHLAEANDIAHRISDEFSKHKNLNLNRMLELYVSFISLMDCEETTFRLTPAILDRTERILSAANYMHSNFGEVITLDKLCELTNMSRSGFSDHFTKIIGVSPMYYLKCIRLGNARVEFTLRRKTLSEIVKLTGLYDKAQLARNFKKHFGMSLTEYRNEKQLRELLLDREIRKRYEMLDELSDFFQDNGHK